MGQNNHPENSIERIDDAGRPSYDEMRSRITDLINEFFRDFFGTDSVTPAKIAKDVSLNTWHGCLKYVNYKYITYIDKTDIMDRRRGGRGGIIQTPRYNLDIVEDLADIYSDLCSAYDKPQSAVAFSDFAGITDQLLRYWGSDKRQDNTNSRRHRIYQKIVGARREAITNRVLDGGARTLGAVTMYNNEVLPGASRSDSGGMIAGDSLPRLGLPGGDD